MSISCKGTLLLHSCQSSRNDRTVPKFGPCRGSVPKCPGIYAHFRLALSHAQRLQLQGFRFIRVFTINGYGTRTHSCIQVCWSRTSIIAISLYHIYVEMFAVDFISRNSRVFQAIYKTCIYTWQDCRFTIREILVPAKCRYWIFGPRMWKFVVALNSNVHVHCISRVSDIDNFHG